MTGVPRPSKERLTDLFLTLARIPSPSRSERKVADVVTSFLQSLDMRVVEDDTASAIGSDTGNLWCTVEGASTGPHLALGAHLDTVAPTEAIDPVLGEDGVFRNSRPTILGSDDKAAIAALLHATELLKRDKGTFPSYELVFTVSEEIGLLGSKHLDPTVPCSPLAAVLDSSGPVGDIVIRAPAMQTLRAVFQGQAAHAGLEPERGKSAIQAAARAVARMSLGRLDEETTANIGLIKGGVATNVVPDRCVIEGECRGHDEQKLAGVAASMVDIVHEAATQTGVDVDVGLIHEFSAFSLSSRVSVVRLARAAVGALGLSPRLISAGGGSDANVFNARGIPTINLATGMMLVHSPDEYLPLDELERLCRLVLELIRQAPEFGPRSRRGAFA